MIRDHLDRLLLTLILEATKREYARVLRSCVFDAEKHWFDLVTRNQKCECAE